MFIKSLAEGVNSFLCNLNKNSTFDHLILCQVIVVGTAPQIHWILVQKTPSTWFINVKMCCLQNVYISDGWYNNTQGALVLSPCAVNLITYFSFVSMVNNVSPLLQI